MSQLNTEAARPMPVGETAPLKSERTPRSQVSMTLSRLRQSPHALVGGTILGSMVILAIFAPLIAPHDPYEMHIINQFQPPSAAHPFGTDEFGRDMLTRVIYGGRLSLRVGLLATAIALSAGTVIGLIAGYYGRWFDLISQRVIEIAMAFPGLVLALAIIAILGSGLQNVMLALAIGGIPYYARLVRGQVLAIREREYIEAARVVGASDARVLVRHVLPGTISPLIVVGSLDLAGNILAAAGLSFIGLGAQPPTPEWGAMLSAGRDYMREQWWIATFPGIAIMLAVLALNLLGDGLRDALDPQSQR